MDHPVQFLYLLLFVKVPRPGDTGLVTGAWLERPPLSRWTWVQFPCRVRPKKL